MTNEELVILIQKGSESIEKLYLQNLGLLKMISNRLSQIYGYEFEDLLQESYFGLIKAVDNYDPDRGYKFSTYAVTAITRYLQRHIDNTGHLIRRPVYKNSLLSKYERFVNDFIAQHEREPFDFEVCESLQIVPDQLEQLKTDKQSENVLSLSEPISEGSSETIADAVSDPVDNYEDVENRILQGELAEKIWEAVNTLKADQQTIIKQYYVDDLPLKKIADNNDCSLDAVIRDRNNALKELRNKHGSKLQPFLDAYGIGLRHTSFEYWKSTGTSATEYAAIKLLEMEGWK